MVSNNSIPHDVMTKWGKVDNEMRTASYDRTELVSSNLNEKDHNFRLERLDMIIPDDTDDRKYQCTPNKIGSRKSPDDDVLIHKKRKTVTFHLDNNTVIEPNYLFDDESMFQLWYRSTDYNRFVRDAVRVAALLRLEGKKNSDCIRNSHLTQQFLTNNANPRGLEHFISLKARDESHNRRSAVRDAVFIEQNRQRRLGFNDPNIIHSVCVMTTQHSSLLAYQLGQSDAIDANQSNYGEEIKSIEVPAEEEEDSSSESQQEHSCSRSILIKAIDCLLDE